MSRLERIIELEPGTYVFVMEQGPGPGYLTRADGTEIEIDRVGDQETIRVREPERVVISYEANGRPPQVSLKRVR